MNRVSRIQVYYTETIDEGNEITYYYSYTESTDNEGDTGNESGEDASPVKWVTDINDATLLTTSNISDAGVIDYTSIYVYNLQAGTYYLQEVTSPIGYELLTEDVVITIEDRDVSVTYEGTTYSVGTTANTGDTSGWSVVKEDEDTDTWIITVPNSTGYEIPHTGGIGTAVYTIGGILLAGGALTLLLRSRKRRKGVCA